MKRLTICILMAMTAMMATTMAQGRALGGSWLVDTEKSGAKDGPPGMTITLTATEFTVKIGEAAGQVLTFKLDGSESELPRGAKGKAQWKGDKLEATIITPNGPQVLTFFREGAWLVNESQSGRGPMKLYFKKAPAKS